MKAAMYTQLAEIPLPISAQFVTPHDHSGSTIIEVTYSLRDHIRKSKRTVSKSIIFSSDDSTISTVTPYQEIDLVAQLVSPSTKRRAVLRAKSGGSRFIEIWNGSLLEASLDVTDYHGDFYADEFLASLSFAPSERAILYTAEGKAPETDDPFEKFRYKPDFGEGLSGKRRPVLFLFSWQTDGKKSLVQLSVASGNDSPIAFGQAVFSPNSESVIYATGYELTVDGRILGPKGCYNRPTGIWQLHLSGAIPDDETKKPPAKLDARLHKLTPSNLSCRSPRVSKPIGGKGSFLIWLADKTGGAHLGTSSLYSLDITSDLSATLQVPSQHEPLVRIVDIPRQDGFPGLYPPYNLPTSSILSSTSPSIILQSYWGSRSTVLQISAADGKIENLTPVSEDDGSLYSWSVLATDCSGQIICSRSSPSVPYEVMLGQFDEEGSLSWRSLDKPALPDYIETALASITTKIIPIPGRHLVETILIQGKNSDDSISPCITSPHGGPHGVTTTGFSPTTTALVLEGYTLSLPNYTGSPGFGDAFLQGLVGRCGELDVQDCIASARHLVSIGISKEGPGMQLITGGSHGGFLTAHLISQFPTFFSAAIMRNPVISVGEISTSDIRDWYFSEFALPYPISSSPVNASSPAIAIITTDGVPPLVIPETYNALYSASPISLIDNVRIPVLLLIGASDRRVAPTQGIDYYHALKARSALKTKESDSQLKVDMLIFEGEGHPLEGVEAAKAGFEATKKWFGDAALHRPLK